MKVGSRIVRLLQSIKDRDSTDPKRWRACCERAPTLMMHSRREAEGRILLQPKGIVEGNVFDGVKRWENDAEWMS